MRYRHTARAAGGRTLLALTLLSPLAVPSIAGAGEPARPDPAAILGATARAYSQAHSLQVHVRTEVPFPRGKPGCSSSARACAICCPSSLSCISSGACW